MKRHKHIHRVDAHGTSPDTGRGAKPAKQASQTASENDALFVRWFDQRGLDDLRDGSRTFVLINVDSHLGKVVAQRLGIPLPHTLGDIAEGIARVDDDEAHSKLHTRRFVESRAARKRSRHVLETLAAGAVTVTTYGLFVVNKSLIGGCCADLGLLGALEEPKPFGCYPVVVVDEQFGYCVRRCVSLGNPVVGVA